MSNTEIPPASEVAVALAEVREKARIRNNIVKQILFENGAQDMKWGEGRNLPKELWMTILGEEFGEACQAALQDNNNYRNELIQVAAVAIAAIESYDRT